MKGWPREGAPSGTAQSAGWGRRWSALVLLLPLLAGAGACTLDLTDPPLDGDEPARIIIGITVSELEGEGACWSVRISTWPLLRDGRFVPAPDSTAHIAGTEHLPLRRPHELSPFIYRKTRECGNLPGAVALSVPWLDGIGELDWPLEAMPVPRGVAPSEVVVSAGGVAWIDVPIVSPPFPFSGEVISFWNARVSRAPDAPVEQEDHQLLTNSSAASPTALAVGPPFTSVAGTLWNVRWGTLTRIDEITASGRLEAALEFSVTRVTRLRVVADAQPAADGGGAVRLNPSHRVLGRITTEGWLQGPSNSRGGHRICWHERGSEPGVPLGVFVGVLGTSP